MARAVTTSFAGGERSRARPYPETSIAPDLESYDHHILFAFSGGKDSLACLLHLIDEGADSARIELHHHDVDGRGPPTFDWPITAGYCRAVAAAFGVRSTFQGAMEACAARCCVTTSLLPP